MKNLPMLIFSIVLILSTGTIEAQKRTTKKVVKGKRGKTVVVRKTNKSAARAVNRKRVKRTRVVHYHYKNMPRRGAIVKTVHTNAITINHKGVGFRFHTGVWYQPLRSGWKVVRPARGIRIRTLPVGYRRVKVGPTVYYYYYGTYYVQKDQEYEVVDTPIGAEVDSLPEGYETVSVGGEEYYELDGTYYMPSANEEGEEVLVAVPNPKSE